MAEISTSREQQSYKISWFHSISLLPTLSPTLLPIHIVTLNYPCHQVSKRNWSDNRGKMQVYKSLLKCKDVSSQIKALLIFHSPKGNAETVFLPSVITIWVFSRPHWGIRYSSRSAESPLIQGATPMWYMSSAAQSTKGTAGLLLVACSVAFAPHITPSFLRKAQFSVSGNHSFMEGWPRA